MLYFKDNIALEVDVFPHFDCQFLILLDEQRFSVLDVCVKNTVVLANSPKFEIRLSKGMISVYFNFSYRDNRGI